MGEVIQVFGPVLDQIFVQNVDTKVDDIEITIRKPAPSVQVRGQIRYNNSAPNSARVTECILAINGVVVESTRKRRVQDYTAGSFKVCDTFGLFTNLQSGDTIQLWGLQSVDATTQAAAGFCKLEVVHFGPEMRPQGFLEDTG